MSETEIQQRKVCIKEVTQWLESRALPMSLPDVKFRTPLGAGLAHCYDVVSLGRALHPQMLHLTLE